MTNLINSQNGIYIVNGVTQVPLLYHMDDKNQDFIKDLLPWSPELPEHIRKPAKTETQK